MPTPLSLLLPLLCLAACKEQTATDSLTDKRDGKAYKTVNIGEQVWMAENLDYEAEGSVCYDNDPANCEKYGRLYNWATAKNACSEGWHLPNEDEWDALIDYASGKEKAGERLKAKNGFSALPSGSFSFGGGYGSPGGCITGYSGGGIEGIHYAYSRKMHFLFDNIRTEEYAYKLDGYSVRCVRDNQ
uniref:Fibrobacter succinogenes major paralogous domain-containing protein n=1 Tax=uncultured bacterium contig00070 TaxID=1181551 RepID=A0A806K170_9BACT|nr:hypothetical protein [uncultured bacterium contig00070]